MGDYDEGSCYTNDWLNPSYTTWTMTPIPDSDYAYNVLAVFANGPVFYTDASNPHMIYPVAYLKSSIKIVDGNGTIKQPYVLSVQ